MIWLLLFCVDYKTVVNEINPKGVTSLQVVQELTLGDSPGDDREIFGLGIRAAAAPDGTIYVVDPANYRVAIFDTEGAFMRSFGQKGQGPGEFQQPRVVDIDKDGNIVVLDTGSKRMNLYKPSGEFLRDVPLNTAIQEIFDLALLDDGSAAFTGVRLDANFQVSYVTALYDPHMQDLKTLVSIPQPPKDWSKASDPTFWVTFLKDIFDGYALGFPMVSLDGSGHFVVVRTNEYRGDIYNPNGELAVQFSKKFKPKPFAEEARRMTYEKIWQGILVNPFLEPNLPKPVFEKALNQTQAPDFVPPLSGLFRLGKGFAVLANWDEVKKEGNLEIYDAGGNITGTAAYKGPTEFFYGRGNQIYATGLDEEENMVVKRYRVKGI